MTTEILDLMNEQGEAFTAFRKKHEERLHTLEKRLDDDELKAARGALFGGGGKKAEPTQMWIDRESKSAIPVLSAGQSVAALHQTKSGEAPSLGRVLRGIVLGGRAHDADELADERKALSMGSDPSGGYTVAGALSGQWIDRLRSAMVLNRAGVLTVPMDNRDLTIAKLTGDPTVSWHGENDALTDSDATFGAVKLTSKTVVCLVKLSLELAQDSANIESMLQASLTSSLASAIDSAGLVGVTTDAAAGPGGGVFNLTGRNSVTSIGAPTSWDFLADGMYELLLDNVPADAIGAMVAHPALWKKMVKLKTGLSGDNTPLTMPDEVARVPKLWTTAAPLTGGTTAKAVIGDWRDMLFGVRQQITVRVLSEAFLGSNLQVAVLAYARVAFAQTRATSFCTLEGITVA